MILKARMEHISLLMAKQEKGEMEGRCQKHTADLPDINDVSQSYFSNNMKAYSLSTQLMIQPQAVLI